MNEVKVNQILINQTAIMMMLLMLGKEKRIFDNRLSEGVEGFIGFSEKLVLNGAEHATRG